MSWANELYHVYELAIQGDFSDEAHELIPIFHSTANAQIEVTITESGCFERADVVPKEDAQTIIPVTEASGSRGSGICPMPFADKLIYIAGDYSIYEPDRSAYFAAYIRQLEGWARSSHSHKAVQALLTYLKKSELMQDLIRVGILKMDEASGKPAAKVKINGINQEDAFVRFRVQYQDYAAEPRTWRDPSMYASFIGWIEESFGQRQLCYASGKVEPVTYKHPSKIRNGADKAKLISANDESGFAYRGRFLNKTEALSVGYVYSQKLHNALKWLIARQGISIDSMTLLVWASSLEQVPEVQNAPGYREDDPEEWEDYDPEKVFQARLNKYLFGTDSSLSSNVKVMLMCLDSATPGRLSVSRYCELEGSRFAENLRRWHEEICWWCFNGKLRKSELSSFSIRRIADCAYGTEQDKKPGAGKAAGSFADAPAGAGKGKVLTCSKDMWKDTTLRLLPCITERRRIPHDLVRRLYLRASNPQSFLNEYNHRRVLETACGLIRKESIDYAIQGGYPMAYDPNLTDRSYLFGCLLAIADKAEQDSYEKDDGRQTNAKRYWSAFVSRPYQTWGILEERLRPYLSKLPEGSQVYYEKLTGEIMGKMTPSDFTSPARLEPLYLLGYHTFTTYLYKGTKEEQQ